MRPGEQLAYYSRQCSSLMSRLEEATQKLMCDEHQTSDLEKAIWNSIDANDLIRLRALHARLCKLVDEAESR